MLLLKLLQPDVVSSSTPLLTVLTRLRDFSDLYRPPYILWTLFFSAVVATLTMKLVCPDSQRSRDDWKSTHTDHETYR